MNRFNRGAEKTGTDNLLSKRHHLLKKFSTTFSGRCHQFWLEHGLSTTQNARPMATKPASF